MTDSSISSGTSSRVLLKPSDAYQFFTTGQQKIQQGLLREGFELISEAHNLLNNVYGPMHPEISMCLRLLARLNYIMGDYQEALYTQHKAVMMSERVLGIDHPQTATEYVRETRERQNFEKISAASFRFTWHFTRSPINMRPVRQSCSVAHGILF